MKNKNLITTLILMTGIFITCTVHATVFRVNNNPAYNQFTGQTVFNDLNFAINHPSVSPGDTLYVEASALSYGAIIINKHLTIIGTGYFLNLNTGLQKNPIASTVDDISFTTGSDSSTIMGLRIADSNFPIVYLTDVPLSHITITRCFIQNGIAFQNTTATALDHIVITKNFVGIISTSAFPGPITFLMVTNNYFLNGIQFGLNQFGTVSQNVFANSVFIFSSIAFSNNIFVAGFLAENDNTSSTMHHNLFCIGQPAWLTGGNNIFSVPFATIFPATGTFDGILDPNPIGTCPQCYQGYPGTVEVGMYGGNDPYGLSGIPGIPAIYLLQAPPNTYPGGVVNTNISTRSNN